MLFGSGTTKLMMTPDEMIAVIQAHKEGKQLEVNLLNTDDSDCGWMLYSYSGFDFKLLRYRVKPREWWIEPRAAKAVWPTIALTPVANYIHVREVLD